MITVVCCPCGRAATSAFQPASTRLVNASTVSGEWGYLDRVLGRVEFRGLHLRQGDPVGGVRVGDGLAERPHGFGFRVGCGSGFHLHRGPQLGDRVHHGQFGVVRVGTRTGPFGDHPDPVHRQLPLPHPFGMTHRHRRSRRRSPPTARQSRCAAPPTPTSPRTTPPDAPWSSKTLSQRTYHHSRRGVRQTPRDEAPARTRSRSLYHRRYQCP